MRHPAQTHSNMKAKKDALVRVYTWQDLTRLAVHDMHHQLGILEDSSAEFHYIGGLDPKGNPFIRIDLTPLPGTPKFKP